MSITSIKVTPRKTANKDLRDPVVVQEIRREAEKAVRDERTRRRLRRFRSRFN